MDEVDAAIDGLEQLGLTEYEARCFVALTRIPHGTAKEVAQVADVPRSRVYETMDRLHQRGLIEIQQGEPRTFQSVALDTALKQLRQEYESYFETVERELRKLEPVYKERQQAVWAISKHESVAERVLQLIDEATDEVVMTVLDEVLLDEAVLDALEAADDRGVTLHVTSQDEAIRDRVESGPFDAHVFSTDMVEWFGAMSDVPRIGRVAMADRGPVLVSALHDERLPGVPRETATWSDCVDHGFATFVERVITYELQENGAAEGEAG